MIPPPYEPMLRLSLFGGVLLVMMLWETVAPRRIATIPRTWRALNHLALAALNVLVVRLMPFLSAMATARWAEQSQFGLLHLIRLSPVLELVLALVVLDLLIYFQHVAMHKMPLLWRLHRVHHTDLDLDATSGVRFHPLEIVLSMALKCIAVILLGASVDAVILFEMGLNASAMFNHGNVRMPAWCDAVLRYVLVTPDVHRVHHSIDPQETNSNYGFHLPWWDWIFGTYRAQPRVPHEQISLGLSSWRSPRETTWLVSLLGMPFRSPGDRKPESASESANS